MSRKPFLFIGALLPAFVFAGLPGSDSTASKPSRDTQHVHVYKVRTYIHHISDINYREGEYKIELWLRFSRAGKLQKDKYYDSLIEGDTVTFVQSKDDSVPSKLIEQIEVKEAKEFDIKYIPEWSPPDSTKNPSRRKTFKLNCTLINNWKMFNFPFGDQTLNIVVYTITPIPWVILDTGAISFSHFMEEGDTSKISIGNGWNYDSDSVLPEKCSEAAPLTDRRNSAIHYKIVLTQDKPGLLFIKLFLGMYIAFFVAFIALLIPVESEEPRFGLPVGGLFAAIGNKYVIEALLPVSTEFSVVDILHSITIISILLVVAYSAVLLFLNNRKKAYEGKELVGEGSTTRKFYMTLRWKMDLRQFDFWIVGIITAVYILLNIWFILVAIFGINGTVLFNLIKY